ncbi:hypothetical protein AMTR_s00150p00047360 [Amborella trichopoda]|uniref:Uncharacterized protein n=1 Tax=Amborella trichopoda TaxID=13333 RepID=W1PL89_AMBTC|nr:hypothetical protein AMTR_s00150p00047360 [Amborella trichopoda]
MIRRLLLMARVSQSLENSLDYYGRVYSTTYHGWISPKVDLGHARVSYFPCIRWGGPKRWWISLTTTMGIRRLRHTKPSRPLPIKLRRTHWDSGFTYAKIIDLVVVEGLDINLVLSPASRQLYYSRFLENYARPARCF